MLLWDIDAMGRIHDLAGANKDNNGGCTNPERTDKPRTPPAKTVVIPRSELVRDYLWGIGTSDQHGHSTRLQIRVHPVMGDIANEILDRSPADWFTPKGRASHSLNALYNSALKVGFLAILKMLEDMDVDIEELKAACEDLSMIAREERRLQLRQHAIELQQSILQTKGDVSAKSDRLYKSVSGIEDTIKRLTEET